MSTETKVKERPILFSGPMVRAILEGRKTQTRRIVKLENAYHDCGRHDIMEWRNQNGFWFGLYEWNTVASLPCPYGSVGERLWVRESHAIYRDAFARKKGDEVILYRADASAYWNMTPRSHMEAEFNPLRDTADYEPKWIPSIHMPRWASRITLEITGVRVERLKDISEADALAEGCDGNCQIGYIPAYQAGPCSYHFAQLWESINGPGSWALNPWVWVVEFKPIGNL